MDGNGTPYETSSAFLKARRGKRAKAPKKPRVAARGGRGYSIVRCDITIAPRSEQPRNTAEVTRRYILPAILESLEVEPNPMKINDDDSGGSPSENRIRQTALSKPTSTST